MIADVTAVKMLQMPFGIVIPGGTFIYAVTFTVRDALHRKHGVDAAQSAIYAAGVINVLMALYFALTIVLPFPPFWGLQDAYASILMVVPGIVISSIIAELVSELVDTKLYQWSWDTFMPNSHFGRIALSNFVSVPLDSLLFATLAFVAWPTVFGGDVTPWAGILSITVGQSIFKWIVSFIVAPFTVILNK
jgi:hypothetical protein